VKNFLLEPESVVEMIPGRKDLLRKKIYRAASFIIVINNQIEKTRMGTVGQFLIFFLLVLLILSVFFLVTKNKIPTKTKTI